MAKWNFFQDAGLGQQLWVPEGGQQNEGQFFWNGTDPNKLGSSNTFDWAGQQGDPMYLHGTGDPASENGGYTPPKNYTSQELAAMPFWQAAEASGRFTPAAGGNFVDARTQTAYGPDGKQLDWNNTIAQNQKFWEPIVAKDKADHDMKDSQMAMLALSPFIAGAAGAFGGGSGLFGAGAGSGAADMGLATELGSTGAGAASNTAGLGGLSSAADGTIAGADYLGGIGAGDAQIGAMAGDAAGAGVDGVQAGIDATSSGSSNAADAAIQNAKDAVLQNSGVSNGGMTDIADLGANSGVNTTGDLTASQKDALGRVSIDGDTGLSNTSAADDAYAGNRGDSNLGSDALNGKTSGGLLDTLKGMLSSTGLGVKDAIGIGTLALGAGAVADQKGGTGTGGAAVDTGPGPNPNLKLNPYKPVPTYDPYAFLSNKYFSTNTGHKIGGHAEGGLIDGETQERMDTMGNPLNGYAMGGLASIKPTPYEQRTPKHHRSLTEALRTMYANKREAVADLRDPRSPIHSMGIKSPDDPILNSAFKVVASAGGRYIDGPGDGLSDSIPARIDGTQEAALASGEFVVSADTVSDIGNGSSSAGAKKLAHMMKQVRKAKHGTTQQPKTVNTHRVISQALNKV